VNLNVCWLTQREASRKPKMVVFQRSSPLGQLILPTKTDLHFLERHGSDQMWMCKVNGAVLVAM
jgi:hypothetical protein